MQLHSEWPLEREIGRKLIHLLSLVYLVLYFVVSHYFSHKAALLALSGLLIVLIELEYVRIEIKAKLPILSYVWQRYRRRHEGKHLGGEVFFLLGSIIVLASFDLRVAVAAILMTTFGDLVSAIGSKIGKLRIPRREFRSFEGTFAEFIVDVIVGFYVVRTLSGGTVWWLTWSDISGFPLWGVIIGMAFTATFVETLVTKLDDNLLIPLFSGFVGHALLVLLGYATF